MKQKPQTTVINRNSLWERHIPLPINIPYKKESLLPQASFSNSILYFSLAIHAFTGHQGCHTSGGTAVSGPLSTFFGHQPKHSLGKTPVWEPLCYLSLHDRKLALQTSISLVLHNIYFFCLIQNHKLPILLPLTENENKEFCIYYGFDKTFGLQVSRELWVPFLSVILPKCTADNLFWKITVWAAGIYYDVIRKLLLQ